MAKWSEVAQSCPTLCDPLDCSPPGSSVHGDSPGKNTGVGCHALLQGIFPTQGSNPGLPHCRWSLSCLSYQGSPRILEWVAYPFSKGSSQPRNQTWISCIAGRFFTVWATRETLLGKSGGQLLIAPERMKWLGQSRKDAELWMCTMVKVKSDAIKKNNITQEPWKLGPWIKVNWM